MKTNVRYLFLAIIAVLFFCDSLFAEGLLASSMPVRSRVFTVKQISVETAIKFLEAIDVESVSVVPDTKALVVTATSEKLVISSSLLGFVDSGTEFAIEPIIPDRLYADLPSNKQLQSALTDINIGTFIDPPANSAEQVIIDNIDGEPVVVASAENIKRIMAAIEDIQAKAEISESGQDGSDELFGELVKELSEAHKQAKKSEPADIEGEDEDIPLESVKIDKSPSQEAVPAKGYRAGPSGQ